MTTPDMNACAKQAQEKVESALNVVYQEVMKSLSTPDAEPEAKPALVSAQRVSIKFREADCQAVYVYNQGGTMRMLMHIECL